MERSRWLWGALLAGSAAVAAASCGSSSSQTTGTTGGHGASGSSGAGTSTAATTGSGGATTAASTGAGASGTGGSTTTTGTAGAGTGGGTAGPPAGWLYTSGAKIYVSDGHGGGTQWMGRGVNFDDIFLCGYDNTLWMPNPGQTLQTMAMGLVGNWKPTFVRVSLGMASYPTVVSWLSNPAQYKTPMTDVINSIGANPGVYVLVTLRSDASMILQDTIHGDPEATGLPSDATSSPDKNKFPTGTDAVYQALVDTFADAGFVLFGLTNEPGGNQRTNAQIAAAMSHAVSVIRAEEDKLHVPHHLVSVQGNNWTSDISFYSTTPLPYDNVVYEVHGYPPAPSSYTYPNIPVILGEYGSLANASAFYMDVESKQIPNLAWDFDSFSNCAPDLLQVNQSATNLMPTAWGSTVQAYLLAH